MTHFTQPENAEPLLTAALEHKPLVAIPVDFAARVAASVQTMPIPTPRRQAIYGELAAAISFAILLVAMFALAPWTQPSFTSLGFDLELLLLGQMLGLAAWQFLRHPVPPEISF